MKFVPLYLLMMSFFMYSGFLFSQQKKSIYKTSQPSPNGIYRCLSDEYNAELLKKHPEMMGSSIFEKKLQNNTIKRKASKLQNINGVTLVRIPVVVHVIHNGTAIGTGANISDAQVLSQIQVLNDDFRKMAGTRGENSHPDGADTNIEFYLAREDADCNPTTGINRLDLSSISTTWSGPGGNSDSVLKPMTIWDPSMYLNMWTVTFSNSSDLGYAQFPGGPPETDGVVMGYQYFGSNDAPGVNMNGSIPYDLGRTTTHEVGHYFGLYHTFQDGCADGDLVADTPATAQENYDCPTGQDSCPVVADGILDMIENYMDYTDDSCMNIFTNGQSARIDGVLSGTRFSLANSTVSDTDLPSVSYDSSIKIINLNLDPCTTLFAPEIRLSNFGTVTLTETTISYDLNGGNPIIINWTGSLVEGDYETINLPSIITPSGVNTFNLEVSQSNTDQRNCNDTDSKNFNGVSYESTDQVHLYLTTDGFPEETRWEFRDSSDNLLYSETYNDNLSNENKNFTYAFDVALNECYTFTIFDDFNDGICCEYGNGSYTLKTDDNTTIRSGGVFGASEFTVISTTPFSIDNYFITNNVRLFPNPTTSGMTIGLFDLNNLPDNYTIYNILGQSVLSKTVNNPEDLMLNTSKFSNGIYFIRLTKKNEALTIPFIKK